MMNHNTSPPFHQARSAADKMLGRMRTLVDNMAVALDGPPPTLRDKLVENWTLIQEFYSPQRQDDNRKLRITDTTVPYHLDCMLKILAQEMHHQQSEISSTQQQQQPPEMQPLEFGPCVEYLLQYHVLSDLVDFADADQPRGMRKYALRFFGVLVGVMPLGLLPESAIRLPLVAVMRQCLHVVQTSATTPINPLRRQEPIAGGGGVGGGDAACRLGQGYHRMQNDRTAVILAHDLLDLIVTLFARLREHASMAHLFFDIHEHSSSPPSMKAPGSGCGLGGGDRLAVAALRAAAAAHQQLSSRGHELFIVHVIVEYLLAPGRTGQLAREALVLVVQVLLAPSPPGGAGQEAARYVGFLLDEARLAELLVEHMGYLHAQMPVFRPMPRSPAAQLFSPAYAGARLQPPLQRRLNNSAQPQSSPSSSSSSSSSSPDSPARRLAELLAADSVLRSVAQQDRREAAILASARMVLEHVDAFFLCWELLDEVAVVAAGDARVAAAVQTQLSSGFLRTHIAPALLATMQSRSQAITTVSYLTDLITVTHSTRVLDALFVVLLGADTAPEQRPMKALPPLAAASAAATKKSTIPCFAALSSEDQALLESIEDDALRAEAALLLLPPGTDLTGGIPPGLAATNGGQQQPMTTTAAESSVSAAAAADPCPLRTLLIGWMTINDDDRSHLALNTLRLFDTILSTLNQFAFTSLVLRNFTEDNKSTHGSPPALGLGVSVAADQELVRAVIERFLDAAPSNIANAMPEVVVSTAMHIDKEPLISGDNESSPLSSSRVLILPSRNNFQAMCSQIMRDNHGCDEYVDDCLDRVRANRRYISQCWQQHQQSQLQSGIVGDTSSSSSSSVVSVDDRLADFYPGAFLSSLIGQFSVTVKRHMAYNLMLTSMVNKLACIGDPALTAYLFLANGATMPTTSTQPCALLYDSLVAASADAYVKSERVPRFPARLARQRYEGVETAIKVGAAHPMSNDNRAQRQRANTPPRPPPPPPTLLSTTPAKSFVAAAGNGSPVISPPNNSSEMDVDDSPMVSRNTESNNREDVARAVRFLGTPIKRFVHGFIVLDEFAKEMAATALALHTVELDLLLQPPDPSAAASLSFDQCEEYADLLEYFDPEEPAYRRAVAVQQSLRGDIINLGPRDSPLIANEEAKSSITLIQSPQQQQQQQQQNHYQQNQQQRRRRRSSGSRSNKQNGRRRSSRASNITE